MAQKTRFVCIQPNECNLDQGLHPRSTDQFWQYQLSTHLRYSSALLSRSFVARTPPASAQQFDVLLEVKRSLFVELLLSILELFFSDSGISPEAKIVTGLGIGLSLRISPTASLPAPWGR